MRELMLAFDREATAKLTAQERRSLLGLLQKALAGGA